VSESADAAPEQLAAREAVARARRLQEARDSLEYEQEREAMLRQRLEPMVRDAEGWRADEVALARLSPEHAETLRRIGFVQGRPSEDAAARFAKQISELEAQLDDSRQRQAAFAAYAEALERG
jgi:hypothetical protein